MARQKKVVDPEAVRKLASIQCTVEEIAVFCGCSKDTLERRFMDTINAGRAAGRSSLRREQWKQAEKGNVTMLIWLGKQILGQRDFRLENISDELLAAEVERRMKDGSKAG